MQISRFLLPTIVALVASAASALDLELEPIATGLSNPVFVTQAPGDNSRLYIVERTGNIRLVKDGVLQAQPFVELDSLVDSDDGEQGLLGLAFAPDYATSGKLYIDYTADTGANPPPTRICRLQRSQSNPDRAEVLSITLLLEIAQPFANHNGGCIAFGPDGYLYIGMGDGGSGNDPNANGLNRNALLGKILRLDVVEGGEGANTGGVAYDIPPSNPYARGGGLPEIWAYGMRNPWRFGFDKETGDLWIGDVGQNAQEEIDFQPHASTGGENYGWGRFEGTRCNTNYVSTTQDDCDALAPSVTFPVYTYANPTVGRAVIGGYVYRGAAIPELTGHYFFGDYSKGFIKTFPVTNGVPGEVTDRTSDIDSQNVLGILSSFGEDNAGEIYVCDLDGAVYKIVSVPPVQNEGELSHYSADVDSNQKINLSEVLRPIQFYNTGGYFCLAGTEDGFAPGLSGDQSCALYDCDTATPYWDLSLSELLRVIQFYNSAGFEPCQGTEDGFCPL